MYFSLRENIMCGVRAACFVGGGGVFAKGQLPKEKTQLFLLINNLQLITTTVRLKWV